MEGQPSEEAISSVRGPQIAQPSRQVGQEGGQQGDSGDAIGCGMPISFHLGPRGNQRKNVITASASAPVTSCHSGFKRTKCRWEECGTEAGDKGRQSGAAKSGIQISTAPGDGNKAAKMALFFRSIAGPITLQDEKESVTEDGVLRPEKAFKLVCFSDQQAGQKDGGKNLDASSQGVGHTH